MANLDILNDKIIYHPTPIWGTIMIWVFIAGMTCVTLKTLITWIRLIKTIRSGDKIHQKDYTLVIIDTDQVAPFSWIKYVVINRTDYDNNLSSIITHELKHVSCHHWLDLLIGQMVCIINWFNPTAWLMRDELMLVHEYQADMAVIDSGYDVQQYQMILIRKAVGTRFPSLANSLNHSKLKKRITMMYQEKSGAGRKFKALALVPMLALALGVAAVPTVRAAVSTISSSNISINKGSENPASDKTLARVFRVIDFNNYDNATTITIKGQGLGNNITVSGGTFTTMGKTYKATALQCNMTDGVATITAKFPFTSEYENSSMTLTVDGDEVPFDLEKFFDKSRVAVQVPENMEIYLDGEKITDSQMQELPPDKIASMTIDNQNNVINITLKK